MKIRLFINEKLFEGVVLTPSNHQIHYLKTVLRLETGRSIFVFNQIDGEFEGVIFYNKNSLAIKVIKYIRKENEEKLKIHLAFANLKKDPFAEVLDKGTQVGVYAFCPITTQHSNVYSFSNERAEKIIIESAEQSERISIPKFFDLQKFEKLLTQIKTTDTVIFCDEKADAKYSATALFLEQKAIEGNVYLFIGPEGGFDEKERHILSSLPNSIKVSLGKNILRAETASICISFLLNLLNSLKDNSY